MSFGRFRDGAASVFMHALRSEIRLDRAGKLDGQRIAVAVLALAGLDANPALADAIFGDVGFLDALEAHADVALEQLLIVVWTARVGGKAIGQGVVHDFSTHSIDMPAARSGAPFFSISGPMMLCR